MFGSVSGAPFNPAVSLAFTLRCELPWHVTALYVAVQVIAAIAGAWIAHLMFDFATACCSPFSAAWSAHRLRFPMPLGSTAHRLIGLLSLRPQPRSPTRLLPSPVP